MLSSAWTSAASQTPAWEERKGFSDAVQCFHWLCLQQWLLHWKHSFQLIQGKSAFLWVHMVTCRSADLIKEHPCLMLALGTDMHILTENIQWSDDPSVWSHDKPWWRECALCEFMGLEDTGESAKFCSFGCYECGLHSPMLLPQASEQAPQLRSIQCGNGCSFEPTP